MVHKKVSKLGDPEEPIPVLSMNIFVKNVW